MHILIATGILAALVGFAFGENAARVFVGVALAGLALFVLGIVGLVVLDSSRQRVTGTGIPASTYVVDKRGDIWTLETKR